MSKLVDKLDEPKRKETLGVPVGPPPDLKDFPDLDSDAENDEAVLKKYVPKSKHGKLVPKPNSLQQRMLAISGQNIDDFMKEMESVHKKKVAAGRLGESEESKEESVDKKLLNDDDDEDDDKSVEMHSSDKSDEEDSEKTKRKKQNTTLVEKPTAAPLHTASAVVAPATPLPMPISLPNMPAHPHMHVTGPPVPPLGSMAPPPMMFRPPPRPPGMHAFGIRMPPGPPPGPRPGMPRMGIRIPGPPPGMPPRMAHHKNQQLQKPDSKGVTTITAKPQIRYIFNVK